MRSWSAVITRLIAGAVWACGVPACGGDDSARSDEYVDALRERDHALCACRDPSGKSCESTAASECGYDVARRHAGEFADSLPCLTQLTRDVTSCIPAQCNDAQAITDINACAAQVSDPSCKGPSDASRQAIESELEQRCDPLARCPDGTVPMNNRCPILLPDAGPPSYSCAGDLVSSSDGFLSEPCAQCICDAVSEPSTICGADCWKVFECGHQFCAEQDAATLAACLGDHCGPVGQSALNAGTLARMLEGRCADACAAEGI